MKKSDWMYVRIIALVCCGCVTMGICDIVTGNNDPQILSIAVIGVFFGGVVTGMVIAITHLNTNNTCQKGSV